MSLYSDSVYNHVQMYILKNGNARTLILRTNKKYIYTHTVQLTNSYKP